MTKYRGYRAILRRNTTGSTYATVGQVLEIGDVGSTRALIDVSAHGDEWMDFLGGRQDGTEFSVRVAFDPADAQHVAMKTDYDNGTTKLYHLEHPDIVGRGLEFTATLNGYLERAPQGGGYEAAVNFKIVNPGVTTYVP